MWFYVIVGQTHNFKSEKLYLTNKQAELEAIAFCERAYRDYHLEYSYYTEMNLDGEL